MAATKSHRLVFQDGTISRLMHKDEAITAFRYPNVAEIVHVKLRKSGSAIAETDIEEAKE